MDQNFFLRFRMSRSLTQWDVAEATGLSQGHISLLETGKTVPSIRTFTRYIEAYGFVPVNTMYRSGNGTAYDPDLMLCEKAYALLMVGRMSRGQLLRLLDFEFASRSSTCANY